MSEADNRSYDNLIVLCEAHATEIDKVSDATQPRCCADGSMTR